MQLSNPLQKIKDAKKREQLTEICKRLQIIYRAEGTQWAQKAIDTMCLPLAEHLFITGKFSELMNLQYN